MSFINCFYIYDGECRHADREWLLCSRRKCGRCDLKIKTAERFPWTMSDAEYKADPFLNKLKHDKRVVLTNNRKQYG
jgi:hypothetical protein